MEWDEAGALCTNCTCLYITTTHWCRCRFTTPGSELTPSPFSQSAKVKPRAADSWQVQQVTSWTGNISVKCSSPLSCLIKIFVVPAGKCFCLYPEDRPLPAETRPHIVEADITSTVLFLRRMEIAGLRHCAFMDRPGEVRMTGQNKHGGCVGGSLFRAQWLSDEFGVQSVRPLLFQQTGTFCFFVFFLLGGSEPCLSSTDSSCSASMLFRADLLLCAFVPPDLFTPTNTTHTHAHTHSASH